MYIHTYIHSYLASFLHPHCVQLASLYCHALLGYWDNKKCSFLEDRCRLFDSQIMKRRTSTNNYELTLADKIFSYLPTNWLDKLNEVNGDSIANKESILHIWPNSRARNILHASSFSIGQWIQGLIRTYRDNICKFIVYILLILKFSFKNSFKMSITFVGAHARQFVWCGHECNGCPFKINIERVL